MGKTVGPDRCVGRNGGRYGPWKLGELAGDVGTVCECMLVFFSGTGSPAVFFDKWSFLDTFISCFMHLTFM